MKSPKCPEFPLRNAFLMVVLALAYPLTAVAAPAGVAQFTAGEVNVRRADGRAEALVKGGDIESGQAIVTGAGGRAQLKFSDGGLVSLQPNTEFKISNYVDQADPKQDRFLVDLLRGSMRAITGLIGKRNRDNYKVMTTTATIGIRGSGFNAGYNPDGTLGVTTELDAIEVCNAAGCVPLTAGESVVVLNNLTLPRRTNTRADVPTPDTRQDPLVAGNQVDNSGRSAIVAGLQSPQLPPPAPEPLAGIAFVAAGATGNRAYDLRSSSSGLLTLDASTTPLQPTAYTSDAPSPGSVTSSGTTTVIGSTGSVANNDYMVLGTWDSANWANSDNTTSALLKTAFAAGVPSPSTAFTNLLGMRGTYSLLNATPVFSSADDIGQLQPTSTLTADFSSSYVDVNLDILTISKIDYNLRGGLTWDTSSSFSGSLVVSGSGCSGAAVYCGQGTVAGSFSGAEAQNAFLGFGAVTSNSGTLSGAATFTRTGDKPVTTPSHNQSTDLRIELTDGGAFVGQRSFASDPNYTTVTPSFYGEKMNSFTTVDYSGTTTLGDADLPNGTFGAVGHVSDPNFIGWGSWIKGSYETTGTVVARNISAGTSTLDAVHYIVGRPTPYESMPGSGIGNYSLIGGTAPTATLNGSTQAGALVSASLQADFGMGNVTASVTTQFGDTSAGFSGLTGNINGSTFSAYDQSSGNSFNGFFVGDQATRAGMVYTVPDSTLGLVTGAAAFQLNVLNSYAR